jgi:hypothetical protein
MAMATLVAGETVELTLQGLTRHDPVKLAWGELHMSCDCFSEADDAVPGTPSRRERRPAPHRHPTRVMEEVRKRIVEAYPDRFGPEADKHGEMSLETLAALGGGCWVVCFDSDYAKVCEFCLSGLRTPWDFQEWKIWDHIESGSIFAHARVLYSKEPKLLSPGPEGTFFSFHHDRNAGRPCSAPRL